MTYEQFVAMVSSVQRANRNWRYGQTISNVLTDVRPDLAGQVWDTDLDPYYADDHSETIPNVLVWISTNW